MKSELDELLRKDRDIQVANRAGEMLRDCLLRQIGVDRGAGMDLWKTAKVQAAEAIESEERARNRRNNVIAL